MTGTLAWLLDTSVVVFAVASMLSVGFGHTVRQVLGPLRNVGAVVRALAANFVLVPLFALLVLRLVPLPAPHAIGIFLIATAAGAPFLIKLAEVAASDVGLSATLLVVLLPATIVYMPIVVPLALPGADVRAIAIAAPLVLSMLLPLAVGLFVRQRSERLALRLHPGTAALSTLALVVLVLSTVLAHARALFAVLLTTSVLAAILVIAGAFVIGYALGLDRTSREVLGLGTSQRNIAAATVVASRAVRDPNTVVVVVVASLLGLALLFPVAVWLRKRSGNER